MICCWSHGNRVFEFDAISRAEAEKRARAWAKENGWKFSDLEKHLTETKG